MRGRDTKRGIERTAGQRGSTKTEIQILQRPHKKASSTYPIARGRGQRRRPITATHGWGESDKSAIAGDQVLGTSRCRRRNMGPAGHCYLHTPEDRRPKSRSTAPTVVSAIITTLMKMGKYVAVLCCWAFGRVGQHHSVYSVLRINFKRNWVRSPCISLEVRATHGFHRWHVPGHCGQWCSVGEGALLRGDAPWAHRCRPWGPRRAAIGQPSGSDGCQSGPRIRAHSRFPRFNGIKQPAELSLPLFF